MKTVYVIDACALIDAARNYVEKVICPYMGYHRRPNQER